MSVEADRVTAVRLSYPCIGGSYAAENFARTLLRRLEDERASGVPHREERLSPLRSLGAMAVTDTAAPPETADPVLQTVALGPQ